MLSYVFRFKLPEISTSKVIKDLVRSFSIERPFKRQSSLSWDLSKVLEFLSSPPFEPLEDCSLRDLISKTLFSRGPGHGKKN